MTHHCVSEIAHDMFFTGNTFAEWWVVSCSFHATLCIFHQIWKQYGNNMDRKSCNQNLWVNVLIKQTSSRVCLLFPHFPKDIISRLRYCSKGDPNYLLNYLVSNQIEVIIALRHVIRCKLVFVDLKSWLLLALFEIELELTHVWRWTAQDLNERKLATYITKNIWSSCLLPWDDCRL